MESEILVESFVYQEETDPENGPYEAVNSRAF